LLQLQVIVVLVHCNMIPGLVWHIFLDITTTPLAKNVHFLFTVVARETGTSSEMRKNVTLSVKGITETKLRKIGNGFSNSRLAPEGDYHHKDCRDCILNTAPAPFTSLSKLHLEGDIFPH